MHPENKCLQWNDCITSSEKWEEMANQWLFFQTQEEGLGAPWRDFSLEDIKFIGAEMDVVR